VCAIIYESVYIKAKPLLYKSRVAKKSVKRAPNLQDLLCLIVFIYIIYLLTILLRFRLPGLKSIYLLREHYTKSIAERSYSLLRGRDFSIQISLPGVIPETYCPLFLIFAVPDEVWLATQRFQSDTC
jgi:hypothetical protein